MKKFSVCISWISKNQKLKILWKICSKILVKAIPSKNPVDSRLDSDFEPPAYPLGYPDTGWGIGYNPSDLLPVVAPFFCRLAVFIRGFFAARCGFRAQATQCAPQATPKATQRRPASRQNEAQRRPDKLTQQAQPDTPKAPNKRQKKFSRGFP